MSDPLLDSLNDAQREAVLHGKGPLLVLAGAGSGKTRVIVHRVAHLVRDEGVMPWHVLAVTFTNKAAGEMKDRLRGLLGVEAEALWVSTFHAFGARFLRREAAAAGLPASFPIYDTDDQLRLMKSLMSEMGLDEGEPISARDALSRIDRWKNHALRAADVRPGELDVEGEAARALYQRYERALERAGATDFGDLIARPLRLLQDDAGVRAALDRALPARAGGRVPGHQPRPGPAGAPAPRPGAQRVRGGRRRPGHLPLARRRRDPHPRVRPRLPGRTGGEARAELPLHPAHPGRRPRRHREGLPPAGEASLDGA